MTEESLLTQQIAKLRKELVEAQNAEAAAHKKAIEIGRQINKLLNAEAAHKKKIAKILGEGQKGIAE